MERWKKRHGIGQATVSGECASVNDDVVKRCRENVLPDFLKRYKPEDIYNMDETGLFYRMQTDKTSHFRGTKCSGGKQGKERITLALTANMNGSHKLTPLAIGKFAKPRCFKNATSLPVDYKHNTKAKMTSDIFKTWLHDFDREMVVKGRKVLMLVDNCPAHPVIQGLRAVELLFLPPIRLTAYGSRYHTFIQILL